MRPVPPGVNDHTVTAGRYSAGKQRKGAAVGPAAVAEVAASNKPAIIAAPHPHRPGIAIVTSILGSSYARWCGGADQLVLIVAR